MTSPRQLTGARTVQPRNSNGLFQELIRMKFSITEPSLGKKKSRVIPRLESATT